MGGMLGGASEPPEEDDHGVSHSAAGAIVTEAALQHKPTTFYLVIGGPQIYFAPLRPRKSPGQPTTINPNEVPAPEPSVGPLIFNVEPLKPEAQDYVEQADTIKNGVVISGKQRLQLSIMPGEHQNYAEATAAAKEFDYFSTTVALDVDATVEELLLQVYIDVNLIPPLKSGPTKGLPTVEPGSSWHDEFAMLTPKKHHWVPPGGNSNQGPDSPLQGAPKLSANVKGLVFEGSLKKQDALKHHASGYHHKFDVSGFPLPIVSKLRPVQAPAVSSTNATPAAASAATPGNNARAAGQAAPGSRAPGANRAGEAAEAPKPKEMFPFYCPLLFVVTYRSVVAAAASPPPSPPVVSSDATATAAAVGAPCDTPQGDGRASPPMQQDEGAFGSPSPGEPTTAEPLPSMAPAAEAPPPKITTNTYFSVWGPSDLASVQRSTTAPPSFLKSWANTVTSAVTGQAVVPNLGLSNEPPTSVNPPPPLTFQNEMQLLHTEGALFRVDDIFGLAADIGPTSAPAASPAAGGPAASELTPPNGDRGEGAVDDDGNPIAAAAAATSKPAVPAGGSKPGGLTDVVVDEADSGVCVICYEDPNDTLVLPCRHMCLCANCAQALRSMTNKCPICRGPIERLMTMKLPPR